MENLYARLLRALLGAVALVLVLGPPMDALTRDTHLAGRPTVAGRLLAAFDAVDDSIDQGHHKTTAIRAHHVQPATAPQAGPNVPPPLTERSLAWPSPDRRTPAGVTIDPAKPPPRV